MNGDILSSSNVANRDVFFSSLGTALRPLAIRLCVGPTLYFGQETQFLGAKSNFPE